MQHYRIYKYYTNLNDILSKINQKKRYLIFKTEIVNLPKAQIAYTNNSALAKITNSDNLFSKQIVFVSLGNVKFEFLQFNEIESAFLYKQNSKELVFPTLYPKESSNNQPMNTVQFLSRELSRLKLYRDLEKLKYSFFSYSDSLKNSVYSSKIFNKIIRPITPNTIIKKYPGMYPTISMNVHFDKLYRYSKRNHKIIPENATTKFYYMSFFKKQTNKQLTKLNKFEQQLINRKRAVSLKSIYKTKNRLTIQNTRKKRFLKSHNLTKNRKNLWKLANLKRWNVIFKQFSR